MKARGKREARRPWLGAQNKDQGLKGRNNRHDISALQALVAVGFFNQGRRASLRSHLPLAVILHAVGAEGVYTFA